MEDNSDKVMVALLPIVSDWSQIDFPHLTLAYAGRTADLSTSDLDGLSKATMSIAMLCNPVTLRMLTKDIFGQGTEDSPKVDVLRFHPNLPLTKMRSLVSDWDVSKFAFQPHMVIGPAGTWNGVSPIMVAFDRVAFCVGNDRQEFRMSTDLSGARYE